MLFQPVTLPNIYPVVSGILWGEQGYYKTLNLSLGDISQVILKENLWLIVSAGFTGSILLVAGYRPDHILWFLPGVALIWIAVIYLWGRHVPLPRVIGIVMLQFIIWLMIGLSFSIILPLEAGYSNIGIAAGAFTISWLIGFISLFAPGGIGIREAILVALLLPLFASTDSSVFAVTHRLLWIVVEFFFGLIAWVFFNLDSG